ncbi:helix-turn-helix domain-containing protein [Natronosporangium hydrolyticum]|uniref:Helix-turn-helix domain-containing protein n=1 Tax=Natronosporangium hydrolyticum TaxID=2811111 RepID=A0A895Y875_9ACTN|nr:helix-turn-helix domain-containing protein [Natronosporangium hydrolyticum]QSB13551.1 helix-turn-helix domain-containing protein [Natronosporangium hydrolyticum]
MSDPTAESALELSAAAEGVRSMAELAALLRRLRRREARRRGGAELTYRQLAAHAGWSHAVVAVYLTGKTLPPTDRFDTLVQLLGASPAEQSALATARDRVEEGRRAASGPARATAWQRPHQLPADVPGFIGRAAELAELDRAAAISTPRGRAGARTLAIVGSPGAGKTALALHWAHRVRHRFPHGQLYTDLRGYGADPAADPARILDGYLAALGVPAVDRPADLDAKIGLYRSLLDRRRVLVVLDNAANARQVRPLLPTAPGSAAVVTSRSVLTGLVASDRAHRIVVDVLPLSEAVALLAGFLGEARVRAELAAVRQLARLCGCLPVALCALGERAVTGPSSSLTALADELATARNRLDLFEAGDDGQTTLRTMFGWSYQQLPADAARLFRALGAHPRPWADRGLLAELCGGDPREARRLVEVLAAANLLHRGRWDRYRLSGLLRWYAAELAIEHGEAAPARQLRSPQLGVESLTRQ